MDIQVANGEIWTVNKAMLNDTFWVHHAVEGLSQKMEAIDLGKQKAEYDLVDLWIKDLDERNKMEEIKTNKRKVKGDMADIWDDNQACVGPNCESFH